MTSQPLPPTNLIHSFPAPSLYRSSSLIFSLNSTRINLENPDPEVTLLDFVRAQGFTGTKLGCAEGGCGACTVVIGAIPHLPLGALDTTLSREGQRPRYRSVNACLTPLIAVHGCHVLTVEGIGSSADPHPVQERIGKMFGSQCGFCTPGIVMSLYATVRNGHGSEELTERAIEQSLDGNLCRCTGYRPILDAAKTFATDAKLLPNVTILDESSDTSGSSSASPERVKTPTSEDAPVIPPPDRIATAIPTEEKADGSIGLAEGVHQSVLDMEDIGSKQAGCGKGGECCMVKGKSGGGGCGGGGMSDDKPKTIPGIPTFTFKPYNPSAEPLFPPYLKKAAHLRTQDLILVKKTKDVTLDESSALGSVWLRPGSLASLLETMRLYPGAKIRSGNTETGIEVKFKASRFAVSVYVSDHLEELATFSASDDGFTVGAAFPLTDLIAACKQQKKEHEDRLERVMLCDAILHNLKHFAGTQVRNVATLAGNITTASPISDLNPVWVAVGATLNYIDPSDPVEPEREKQVAMRDFFIRYRVVALPKGAVVTSLFVPYPKMELGEMVFTKAYKQSKRKDDDIAIVTCCMQAKVKGTSIEDIHLVYGGMAPKTIESKDTQAYLTGKTWGDDRAFVEAMERLSTVDFALPFGVPGGMAVYRKSLTLGFFSTFWAEVGKHLKLDVSSQLSERLADLANPDITRAVSKGSQDLADIQLAKPVGQNKMHLSAMKQCTGEAQYVDDILHKTGELYGAVVFSTKPHAKILGIDTDIALEMEGVAGFVSVKDIHDLNGNNMWNPPAVDEQLFADGEVHTTGQMIGVICADTKMNAQAAARAVNVRYEDLPYILTIDEAIAQDSYFPPRPILRKGDISKLEEESDHVLEGTWRMGGQEHFYLETNGTAAHCEEDVVHVTASTQNPTETQVFVASALGIPQNRVVVRVVRLGGGFGGKETRSVNLSVAAALASKKLKRPVRIFLDRDEDMIFSGARHGFMTKYRIGFKKTGKLVGIDVDIYNNGGWSQDLSQAVLERAMTHQDNCYNIPLVQIRGKICRTNTASNTAFRGFGGPQGLFSMECMIEMVAAKVGRPVEEVRECNFYAENDKTHFGQTLQDWNIPTLWNQIKESSDYDRRKAEVESFNAKNRWRKRGLAIIPTKFGISFTFLALNQATASVNIYQHDGSVLISHGGTEMGQGLHSKMIAVAAEELGTDHENVHIMETNTMVVANTSATAASASSDLNAMAIKNACDQINTRLAPFRAKMPNATWKELTHAAYFDRVSLSAMGFYRTPDIGFDWEKASKGDTTGSRPFFYFTQGTAVSEVEVDTLTGDWTILRADVHMDIGRSINPAVDVGQIEGAFTQGFGLFTMEELLWLPNGNMFTRGPGAYKIPSFLDTPQDMRISFLKAEHAKTAHLRTYQGSKGIGEPPLFLGSSVYFAIKDALDSARKDNGFKVGEPWMLESPATPEKIRLAAGDAIAALAEKNCRPKEGERNFFVKIEC